MATTEAKKKRPTAEKRMLQNEKKRLINKAFKSRVRTAMHSFDESLQGDDAATIQSCLNEVYSLMDKAVSRNISKKNEASRVKARATAKASAKTS